MQPTANTGFAVWFGRIMRLESKTQ
jgi:hypothetical protein